MAAKPQRIYAWVTLILLNLTVIVAMGQQPELFEDRTIGFIENKGQIHDQDYKPIPKVKYLLPQNNGLNVQLRANGFSYDTYIIEKTKKEKTEDKANLPDLPFDSFEDYDISYHFHRIDIELLNANPDPEIIAEGSSSDYLNYYNAVTPEEGATEVRSYQKISYKNIYPNIDLEFRISKNDNSSFKYNFIVHPGGDLSQIKLHYKGAEALALEQGNLQVKTTHGYFYEHIPNSWIEGSNTKIDVQYTLNNENILSFNTASYEINQTLIIDPLPNLEWGTYYGGTATEHSNSIAIDQNNHILITGSTGSNSTMATSGAYQSAFGGGNSDGFLAKFDSSGNRLWGTYYGGSDDEWGWSIAIDQNNNIVITGSTTSTSGMASLGAHQSTFGGTYDGFLAKFNSSGSRLWGTYYGGTDDDRSFDISIDQNNNILITGHTRSNTAIATSGAHQSSFGGTYDGFIAKFNSSGSRLWGTYYGGTGVDISYRIATDQNSNILITGFTSSTSAMATSGAHQSTFGGGTSDGFIAKFSSSGNRLWGTYYGGTDEDISKDILIDINNNVLITGITNSDTAIATLGAYQSTLRGWNSDGFIAKFSSSGSRLWGTYYGGTALDGCIGIATDQNSNTFIIGETSSDSFIATSGAYQISRKGSQDAFLAKFNSSGSRLWGTYYGGSNSESGWGIVTDQNNNILITGHTSSISGIATLGAHQPTNGGSADAFLAKFSDNFKFYDTITQYFCDSFDFNGQILFSAGTYYDTLLNFEGYDSIITLFLNKALPVADFSCNDSTQCLSGNKFEFTNKTNIQSGTISNYYWFFGDNDTSSLEHAEHSYLYEDTFSVKLLAESMQGCRDSITKSIIVYPMPEAVFYVDDPDQCQNQLFRFRDSSSVAYGSLSYDWDFGDGNASNIQHPTHSYSNHDTFPVKLVITSAHNCKDSASKTVITYPMPVIDFSINDSGQCFLGNQFLFKDLTTIPYGTLTNFQWDLGDTIYSNLQNISHTYDSAATFEVELRYTSALGCSDSVTKYIYVHPMPLAGFSFNDSDQCLGNTFQLTNTSTIQSGTLSYLWEFGDGDTSMATNPAHTYSNADTLKVSLHAISDFGCSDSISRTAIVFPIPQAVFSIDDSSQCLTGNRFSFSNSSSISSGNLSFLWDFGDQDTSTLQDPMHNYTYFDTFTVKLISTSEKLCSDTASRLLVVHPMPKADYYLWDTSQCFDKNAFGFINTSSIAHGNLTYIWRFGDGTSSLLKNPVHSYLYADTFNVYLLAKSDQGCFDSTYGKIYIHVHPQPVADFVIDDSAQCLSGNFFNFSNQSTISTGSFTQTWHFGDGDTAHGFDASHTYSTYDTLDVILLVVSDQACKDSTIKKVIVHPMPETDFYTEDSSQCLSNNLFVFHYTTSIPYDNFSFLWNFGDGDTSTLQRPTHSYASSDTFEVSLWVTSAKTCTDSIKKSVFVRPMPVANFDVNDEGQCLSGNNFIFSNKSVTNYGSLVYEWNFGDGDTSTTASPTHTYSRYDTFHVSLKSISNYNCPDSINKLIVVFPMPLPDFMVTDSLQCLSNNLFEFNNLSSVAYGSNTYLWNFGDGQQDTNFSPTHQYLQEDTFAIKLLATTNMQCRDSVSHKVVVFPRPVPSFSINDSTQCLDSNLFSFLNTSIIDNGSMTYQWRIETNNFTATDLLNYHCKDWGKFPVELIATSNQNCKDSITQYIYIYPMPVSAFVYLNNCLEDTMYFYDSSYIDSGMIAQWYWNFGDTNRSSLKDPVNIYKNPGHYGVKLTTSSDYGCSDDSTRFFKIHPHVTPNEVLRASVENDEYIIIEWLPPNQGRPDYYTLEKSEDSINWYEITTFDNDVFDYTDYDVSVNEGSYWYRTTVTDSCAYSSLKSNFARTIHLTIDSTQAFSLLQWTPYEFWADGIEHYEIEIFNEENNTFMPISILPGPDSSLQYTDSFNKLNQKHYCYRVTAYRNGDQLLSHSNTVCTETNFNLFVPTAFTPNKDGLNDVFEPKGTYFISFEMSIYNRWGEKVFETNDINHSWDGTFKGRECPMGAYYFQIHAKGTYTQKVSKTGTVTLIK